MTSAELLFRIWPYAAIALLVVGLLVRALLATGRMPAVARALAEAAGLYAAGFGRPWARRLWAVGLALLVLGHLAGVLFAGAVVGWNAAPWRLYLLEGIAFLIGLGALAGFMRVVAVHLRRSESWPLLSALLDIGDSIFLGVTFVAMGSGIVMAAAHRWGSSWGAVTLAPYVLSLARGEPATALVAGLPWLARLHVFVAFATLASFPLTRLAPLPIVALHRTIRLLVTPLGAAAGRALSWIRVRATRLLWPDPEYHWVAPPERPTLQGQLEEAAARRRRLAAEQARLLRPSSPKAAQ